VLYRPFLGRGQLIRSRWPTDQTLPAANGRISSVETVNRRKKAGPPAGYVLKSVRAAEWTVSSRQRPSVTTWSPDGNLNGRQSRRTRRGPLGLALRVSRPDRPGLSRLPLRAAKRP
jgi:hypothetical protein